MSIFQEPIIQELNLNFPRRTVCRKFDRGIDVTEAEPLVLGP